MRYIAIDTETTLIEDHEGVVKANGRYVPDRGSDRRPDFIVTAPYKTPRLIVGSWAMEVEKLTGLVLQRDHMIAQVRHNLRDVGTHIVFHNAPFDVDVFCEAAPDLWPLFLHALEQDRIHDTMWLDMLVRLADGVFDIPKWEAGQWVTTQFQQRSLETLAKEYCGIELNKDPNVRLGFAQFEDKPLPDNFREYALEDAKATYSVWQALVARCPPDGKLLGEPLQTRAAVALQRLNKRGVRVDRNEAARLRALFEQDMPELQAQLVRAGLGEWVPQPGTRKAARFDGVKRIADVATGAEITSTDWQLWEDGKLRRERIFKNHWVVVAADPQFHLGQNLVRRELEQLVPLLPEPPPRTETGMLSLDGEWWAKHLPADHAGLNAWERHEKLKKIIGTYLKLYSSIDEVFPRWRLLGARSGRMSCAGPNVQNVPKTRHGIRSLFVPRPGYCFIKADYSYMELVTLTEVMCGFGIKGPMYDAIQNGDPHTSTAALLLNTELIPWRPITSILLRDFCAVDNYTLERIAGSYPLPGEGTLASRLMATESLLTAMPSSSGSVQLRQECSSVIDVTTLAALIRNTSLLTLLPATAVIWLRKAVAGEVRLTSLDLALLIGREASAWIATHTHGDVVGVSKLERQGAKALNFGIGGGLGAAKLAVYAEKTYGVKMTPDESREKRARFLQIYPDVADYLRLMNVDLNAGLIKLTGRGIGGWKKELGVDGTIMDLKKAMRNHPLPEIRGVLLRSEHALKVELPGGRRRDGCLFSEGANTYFQGLASDVTKQACFLAEKNGLRTVMVVHDEIVIETTPECAPGDTNRLEWCMLEAFRQLCPNVGRFAKVEVSGPLDRWGPATDKNGKVV